MLLKSSVKIAGTFGMCVGLVCAAVYVFGNNLIALLVAALALVTFGGIALIADGLRLAKLARLKRTGICRDAVIFNLVKSDRPAPAIVRIGHLSDAYIVCSYHDEQGREHTVRSHRFIWDSTDFTDLCAKVYVDKDNTEKHAIEVFAK